MELKEAKSLALDLMFQHGISNWIFEFDNSKKRFGCCKYRSKTISLSKYLTLLNDKEKVKNTILHEIAHALTPGHHHNEVWVAKAKQIGCDGKRCYSEKDTIVVPGKYVAICPGCKTSHHTFRRSSRSQSCGYCSGGKYNPSFKLEFQLNSK